MPDGLAPLTFRWYAKLFTKKKFKGLSIYLLLFDLIICNLLFYAILNFFYRQIKEMPKSKEFISSSDSDSGSDVDKVLVMMMLV